MREALAVVCRQARDEGGYSRTEVAAKIKRGEQSVSRFEQGIGKWNPQTGAMVAAYAELTGVPAWELWQMAINQWRQAPAASEPDARNGRGTAASEGSGRRLRTSVRSELKERPSQADGDPQRKSG